MSGFREVVDALLKAVHARVSEHGFATRRQQSFRKKTELGFHSFHLAVARYDHLVVTPSVAVRFDAVEDLIGPVQPPGWVKGDRKRMQRDRVTLGVGIGNWVGDWMGRNTVLSRLDQIDGAIDQLMRTFVNDALRYFAEYGSHGAALGLLRDDRKLLRHSGTALTRAQKVVALTLLVEGADAAARVVQNELALLDAPDGEQLRETARAMLTGSYRE